MLSVTINISSLSLYYINHRIKYIAHELNLELKVTSVKIFTFLVSLLTKYFVVTNWTDLTREKNIAMAVRTS